MGLRLGGNPLNISNDGLLDSVPVLPGFLQLPPSGDPILLLNDGQTTGGYPRIGYIGKEDLSPVSQVMLGDEIWFCRP
jgi:allophanate hydrolase subunit 2